MRQSGAGRRRRATDEGRSSPGRRVRRAVADRGAGGAGHEVDRAAPRSARRHRPSGAGRGLARREVRPDAIAHLAAVSFAPDAGPRPGEAFEVNVGGTIALMEVIRGARSGPGHARDGVVGGLRHPGPRRPASAERAPLAPAGRLRAVEGRAGGHCRPCRPELGLPVVVTGRSTTSAPDSEPTSSCPPWPNGSSRSATARVPRARGQSRRPPRPHRRPRRRRRLPPPAGATGRRRRCRPARRP